MYGIKNFVDIKIVNKESSPCHMNQNHVSYQTLTRDDQIATR